MTRYKGYRSGTIRHDEWDYRRSAWYFVTICTEDRHSFFGQVRNGVVGLSAAGCIAAQEWRRTPSVRPYVRLDAWIVMPDHIHGLIGITTESPFYSGNDATNQSAVDSSRRDESTATGDGENDNDFRLRAHSLGAIMCQYKSVCTKRIRRNGMPQFEWQSRFYDRIVRTRDAFRRARRYIQNHPDG
jgi:REP element-mobilizing transposase RayT